MGLIIHLPTRCNSLPNSRAPHGHLRTSAAMIIRRLYQFSGDTFSSESTHSIKFVASLIIESGALYLVAGIAHFVAWWTPNDFAIAVISNIVRPSSSSLPYASLTISFFLSVSFRIFPSLGLHSILLSYVLLSTAPRRTGRRQTRRCRKSSSSIRTSSHTTFKSTLWTIPSSSLILPAIVTQVQAPHTVHLLKRWRAEEIMEHNELNII
jgi:hypothetical protein